MAGRAFGLELEGLSPEDRELAAAKRFVRFASEAVSEAIAASRSQDPAAAARARHRGCGAAQRAGIVALRDYPERPQASAAVATRPF